MKKKLLASVITAVLLLSNAMTVSAASMFEIDEHAYPEEGLPPVVEKPSPYEDIFLEPYQPTIMYSINQERPDFYAQTSAPGRKNPTRALFLLTDKGSKPDDPPYDREYRYEYDARGNLLSWVFTDSAGDVSAYDYKRDAQGNLLRSVWRRYGDRVNHNLTYDAQGNLVNDFVLADYNPDGWEEHKYTYDEAGNLSTHDITVFVEKGNVKTYQYTYNAQGNLLTSLWYDSMSYELQTDEFTYDAAGRMLTHVHASEPTQESLIVIPNYFNEQYTYDARGNLVTYTYNSYVGFDKRRHSSVTHQYTYDASGNLLTYTKTGEDKSGVVTRNWQYFYD
ncbi:MAG: hypothetical protein NC337_03415 [Roseburia sp.]|nr:hypothetical protein [Roseburia sp.]